MAKRAGKKAKRLTKRKWTYPPAFREGDALQERVFRARRETRRG